MALTPFAFSPPLLSRVRRRRGQRGGGGGGGGGQKRGPPPPPPPRRRRRRRRKPREEGGAALNKEEGPSFPFSTRFFGGAVGFSEGRRGRRGDGDVENGGGSFSFVPLLLVSLVLVLGFGSFLSFFPPGGFPPLFLKWEEEEKRQLLFSLLFSISPHWRSD